MTPREFDAIARAARPRSSSSSLRLHPSSLCSSRYTERELIEVAVEILENPQFRKSALRWLNRSSFIPHPSSLSSPEAKKP